MKCPACEIEMNSLVAGIFQCPQCKKIVKAKDLKAEAEEKQIIEEGGIQSGEYFHENAGGLNKKYEIADKGITITKTPNRWFAVLLCHSAYLASEKYIRLSWWSKSFYGHGGMIKIHEEKVFINLIKALEKIDVAFDEFWGWQGKYGKQKKEPKSEEQLEKEKKLDIIKARIIENRTCPKAKKKWLRVNLIMNVHIVEKL